MTIVNIDNIYSTEYSFKNALELEFYQRKFICQTYEENKTFLELRIRFKNDLIQSATELQFIFVIHFVSDERKEKEYLRSLTYNQAVSYCQSFGNQTFHSTGYSNGLKTIWLPEGYENIKIQTMNLSLEMDYFFSRDRDNHEGMELRANDYFTGSRSGFNKGVSVDHTQVEFGGIF